MYGILKSMHLRCFAVFVILAVLLCGCVRNITLGKARINGDLKRALRIINKERIHFQDLKNYQVGSTGYFYVIDARGAIVFHPKQALIGLSFGENPFIRKIIAKKNGCLEHLIEGRNRIIFFRETGSLFLCLSIAATELELQEFDCEEFK